MGGFDRRDVARSVEGGGPRTRGSGHLVSDSSMSPRSSGRRFVLYDQTPREVRDGLDPVLFVEVGSGTLFPGVWCGQVRTETDHCVRRLFDTHGRP